MGEFKFEEAVTQAFHTSGGKQFGWRLVFWTAVVVSIFSLIAIPMMMPHYGELLSLNQQNMQALMGGEANSIDSEAMNGLLLKMAPAYLIWMGGYWLAWVMAEAALHRKVLHGTEAPKRPLRLGKDELRVWLAQLGVFGILLLIYSFGIFGFTIFAALGGAAMILAVIAIIALPFLLLLASVRLAPAAALSIQNNKTHVFAAKDLTKGKFWTLFPPYLVTFLGGYIALYIVMIIAVGLVTGDSNFFMTMSGFGEGDPADIMAAAGERFKNPLVMLMGILALIAYSAVYALWMVCLIGVSSHAVKVWNGAEKQ